MFLQAEFQSGMEAVGPEQAHLSSLCQKQTVLTSRIELCIGAETGVVGGMDVGGEYDRNTGPG